MLKRMASVMLVVTLIVAAVLPSTVSARNATWRDIVDSGIFTTVRGHGLGTPTLTATLNGIVLSGRGGENTAHGEHDGIGIYVTPLRQMSGVPNPEIIIYGHVSGEAEIMRAHFFDDRDTDYVGSDIDENGNFVLDITNTNTGVPHWATGWSTRPWIGALPRGDITITDITIEGQSLLAMVTAGTRIPEAGAIDLGMPAGVVYSLLQDPYIQGVSPGEEIAHADIPHLTSSGGRWAATVNPYGGTAITISNRMNEWNGLDFLWEEFKLPEGEYIIQVIGNIQMEDEYDFPIFTIAGSSSPWAWIGEEAFTDDYGDFIMFREFSVADNAVIDNLNGAIGGNMRFRSADSLNNFSLYQLAIVRAGTPLPSLPNRTPPVPRPTATPAPTPTPPRETIIRLSVGNTSANVDGTITTLTDAPFISSDGRTMVPVRFVADAMNATTDWNAATQTVTITPTGGSAITLVVGRPLPDDMGTPEIVGGRTFVPVRFVATRMGGDVGWNATTQTVTITFK